MNILLLALNRFDVICLTMQQNPIEFNTFIQICSAYNSDNVVIKLIISIRE